MAKKKSKNKQTNHERQKVEAAQNKKDYFKRFKHVCDLIHPDLFGTFNQKQIDVLYLLRGVSVKIIPDGDVSKQVMVFANEFAQIVQKEASIPLIEGGAMVSIREYHQIVLPMEILLVPVNPGEFYPNIAKLAGLPWFEQYKDAFDAREEAYYQAMDGLRGAIRVFMSDLRYMIFYVDSAIHTNSVVRPNLSLLQPGDNRIRPEISIRPSRPAREKIKLLNGELRNGIRVTFASPHDKMSEKDMFVQVSIAASDLGFKGNFAERMLPMYVTEHALNRLEERTDDMRFKGYTQMNILSIFTNEAAKRRIVRLADNRMLLEYELFDFKIGYLVISVQYGVILVRTFLLITSSITPEGKILHEQLGLQKLDHQYLGIDKLSTFVNSDILENEDICNLFRKAGCGSLIEFCERLKSDPAWQENEEQIQLAAQMREYLKKSELDEWEMAEEIEN
jgi:hypothetical protein